MEFVPTGSVVRVQVDAATVGCGVQARYGRARQLYRIRERSRCRQRSHGLRGVTTAVSLTDAP